MARIIDLAPLVPEDITILYQGAEYRIPGDLSTRTVFQLIALYERLGQLDAETDAAPGRDEQTRILEEAQGELLALLQIRQPDLAEIPFGFTSWFRVLTAILEEYGIVEKTPAEPEDGEGSGPPARSPRSTGSRASSKSSRSRRTTG